LEKLNDQAAARGDSLIQLYVRRQLLLQDEEEDRGSKGSREAGYLEMLEFYRNRGIRRGEPTAYREYARFLARDGRYGEAIAMIRQAAKLTESFGWHLHLPRLWIAQAEWHQHLGQNDEAVALWKRVDDLLRIRHDFSEKR
jgi:tetratricopeptide (TPR) repeat protein